MKRYQANKKKVNNAGFSLLEVILAMAILALISIPLLTYFTESLRYSSLMAAEQQATVLAQAVTEDLKVQSKLIEKTEGAAAYTVPYLTSASMGYTEVENNLLADGTGSITLSGTESGAERDFDVVITLSTDTKANTVSRPVIYGIDDTTDVLAVERDQKNEAIAYFMAINNAYHTANPDARLFSRGEVEGQLSRRILIHVDYNGTEYLTDIYYKYTCQNLRGIGSSDEWASSKLLDVKMADLKNIYLLYDRDTDAGATDYVELSKTDTVAADFKPELYFVCQNTQNDSSYKLQVKRLNVAQVIHTNISNTEEITGQVIDEYGNIITNTKPLTGNDAPVRLIKIKTEIYKRNHTASDNPYAVIETTKGE